MVKSRSIKQAVNYHYVEKQLIGFKIELLVVGRPYRNGSKRINNIFFLDSVYAKARK